MSTTRSEWKNTEAGLIPQNWDVKRIGEFLKFFSGKAHEQYISSTGRYVVVNSKFISTDGRVRKFSRSNFLSARIGDVLMVMSDLPNGRALAKCYLVDRNDFYAVNQRVCILRSRNDDPRYLRYVLNRNPYFMAFDDGVQQTHLLNDPIKNCPVALPKLSEQRAIADVLENADSLVATLERLIAKKQAIKQGLIQELLTGSTRLPGFTGPWRQIHLRDSGMTYGGLSGKSKEDFGRGSAKYVTFTEVMAGPRLRGTRLESVTLGASERQSRVAQGDVLFNGSSETPEEVALAAVVDFAPKSATYLNSFCFGFRVKRLDLVDPTYLALYFRSDGGRAIVSSLAQGATRYNIAKTKFLELAPELPPVDEQVAIAALLGDAEDEIDILRERLAKARAIKQGMTYELLTGRTRLPITGTAL